MVLCFLFLVSKVPVMFHRTCFHIIFSSVWVAGALLMSTHNGLFLELNGNVRCSIEGGN